MTDTNDNAASEKPASKRTTLTSMYRNVARELPVCPHCSAAAGDVCVTPTGRPIWPHFARQRIAIADHQQTTIDDQRPQPVGPGRNA